MALAFAFTDGFIPQIQDRVAPQRTATGGAVKFNLVDLTCDGSYSAGGFAITAANMGLTQLLHVIPSQGIGGIAWWWDNVNSKLKAFKSSATSIPLGEAAAGDVTGLVVRLLAIGR